MVFEFAALPPEITSTLVYTGPGSAPLMAAATAYANLGAEVSTTATSWESIVSLLTTEQWTGGGSAAAATAAQPIVSYLTDTAAALEQASSAAAASAAAFEAAHASVVSPALVYANRAEWAAALGGLPFTLPQLMALDMEYEEMWVQDATAMSAYQAAAEAAAATLRPVTPLTTTTNPAGPALEDANSAFQAADTPFQALDALDLSSLTDALQIPFSSNNILQSIDGFLGTPSVLNAINGAVNTAAWFTMITIPTAVSLGHTLAGAAVPAAAVSDVVPEAGAAGVVEGTMVRSVAPVGGLGAGAMGSLGQATTVGKLSVPATWSAATPTAELASSTAPVEGSGWNVPVEETGTGMGAPGMPGMLAGAKGAGAYGAGPRYGFKPIVMPKQVVV
ncbi:PPE family protein [Mycobacterium montefiorense]|uniref:PPE family protein PPE43 n=1 Tax=Mycobacterium montefiorense TaxID=154654 RepID=A0AA37UZS3_9MYCO|nr:PPE family protein [Mycobacterium montefiorense]GBG39351.1 PPE family protein PPE43 [Mycobacterium montefiorense]GKU37913.1 PPE family protein PPE43 [Mycobacterium montefiorense]GKU42307.1 PPE family protein PPE43 [Mycobacterium montefiorense]GKU44239.1 PPE family protein PPE43 [Mycobacterium montefiorense]GKU53232.1 PPE family protein PPE43 [Mycobacterium montefiorense]